MILGGGPFGSYFPIYERLQFHRRLLESAREWIAKGEYGIAMIVGQTALEVLTTQVIDEMATRRDLKWLNEPRLFGRTYELTNERLQLVYSGLSEDRIQDHPSWSLYASLVRKRHLVVHEGTEVSQGDAEDFLRCVAELMRHLEAVGAK